MTHLGGVRTLNDDWTFAPVASESKKTIFFAIGSNISIAVAKLAGGLMSGSSAMLAEAAHSLADTMNEVFLLVSMTLGSRKPDDEHPFGYGKERFFWAFLAAVFIFTSGALFSVYQGVQDIVSGADSPPPSDRDFVISYVVLGVAFLSDGTSFLRALWHIRKQARDTGMRVIPFLRQGKDPTVKVVLLEDSAALLGLTMAAAGIFLFQKTNNHVFDAAASIGIGLLLAFVAVMLGTDAKGLLIGEAALPADRERIRQIILRHEGIRDVIQLLTMVTGPRSLLVAARVHLDAGLDGRDIERIAADIDRQLRSAVPTVTHVFLDPTSRREPMPAPEDTVEKPV